jgi:hypothetical protein
MRAGGVRCEVCGVRCAVCGVRCAVCGARCAVCGVRCAVRGARCAVCGVRCSGHHLLPSLNFLAMLSAVPIAACTWLAKASAQSHAGAKESPVPDFCNTKHLDKPTAPTPQQRMG